MRILLVHPPLVRTREVAPPLGLCTLASWLITQGEEVQLLDLDLERFYWDEDDVRRLSAARLIEKVNAFSPELIAFTSMYNNSLPACELMHVAKRHNPSTIVVAGGPHFGAMGKATLEYSIDIDFVIEGEGEVALAALIKHLSGAISVSDVPNIFYRVNGSIAQNPRGALLDLSLLPPIWQTVEPILDIGRYAATIPADASRRGLYIEAGRGCPYTCSFCAPSVFWQRKYRVRPGAHFTARG